MHILVTGATGNIGSEVARTLCEAGQHVVAASRDPEGERSRVPEEVGIREFDFARSETWEAALDGIEGLYLVAPVANPAPVFDFLDQVDATHTLDYIVFSSGRTTGSVPGKPLHEIENRLRAGDTPYTVIRPGWFMQNFLSWLGPDIRDHDRIVLPAGDARTTFADTRDLAEGAFRLFRQPAAHLSKVYTWVGQEPLSHSEVADLFSEALGRKVRYQSISEEAYIERLTESGMPRERAEATAFLYRQVRSGHEAEPVDDLPDLLGHDTRRLRDFIAEHRNYWKKSSET